MLQSKTRAQMEEHELLVSPAGPASGVAWSNKFSEKTLGIPESSSRFWLSDYLLALLSLLCFAIALATVFAPAIAISLGQVNQLIALGFLLQVMALCTQNHLQYFLLLLECLWNQSSLQHFESIIRMSFIAPNTALSLRGSILLCLALPLGLGVAYKNFTGGLTTSDNVFVVGSYGMTGPPGTTNIGVTGMALFVNATLPWWTNPALAGAYGFNLKVDSANRTALLDGPTSEYVLELQGMLQQDDTLLLSAPVNATVAEMVIDLSNPNRKEDLVYWYSNATASSIPPKEATDDYWNMFRTEQSDLVDSEIGAGFRFGLLTPPDSAGWIWNSSFIMTSRWNETHGETFGSAAQGFKLSRQKYNAVWSITASSVSLKSANFIQNKVLTDDHSRDLIEQNYISLQDIYPRMFEEYDWKYQGGRTAPGTNSVLQTPQHMYINSDTTLVAAMLWSRLTATDGLGNQYYNESLVSNSYEISLRYPSKSTYRKITPTLRRSLLLAIVLAINPLILITTLIARLFLFNNAPISKNFGITSILAGIESESLNLLRGAGYSGKLGGHVRVRFSVASRDNSPKIKDGASLAKGPHGVIMLSLEDLHSVHRPGRAQNDRLKAHFVYS